MYLDDVCSVCFQKQFHCSALQAIFTHAFVCNTITCMQTPTIIRPITIIKPHHSTVHHTCDSYILYKRETTITNRFSGADTNTQIHTHLSIPRQLCGAAQKVRRRFAEHHHGRAVRADAWPRQLHQRLHTAVLVSAAGRSTIAQSGGAADDDEQQQ